MSSVAGLAGDRTTGALQGCRPRFGVGPAEAPFTGGRTTGPTSGHYFLSLYKMNKKGIRRG